MSASPYLGKCTESKDHVKTVTRHIWAEYLEEAEENEYTVGVREYYPKRQETIERCFGIAKELHGFRYTQEYGRARMEVKAALTFACMNLKKLAKRRWKLGWKAPVFPQFQVVFSNLWKTTARSIRCRRWFVYRLRRKQVFSPPNDTFGSK